MDESVPEPDSDMEDGTESDGDNDGESDDIGTDDRTPDGDTAEDKTSDGDGDKNEGSLEKEANGIGEALVTIAFVAAGLGTAVRDAVDEYSTVKGSPHENVEEAARVVERRVVIVQKRREVSILNCFLVV